MQLSPAKKPISPKKMKGTKKKKKVAKKLLHSRKPSDHFESWIGASHISDFENSGSDGWTPLETH